MSPDSDAPLPSEPTTRHITPAPEDYEEGSPPTHLVWPLAWMLGAALFSGVLLSRAWPLFGH